MVIIFDPVLISDQEIEEPVCRFDKVFNRCSAISNGSNISVREAWGSRHGKTWFGQGKQPLNKVMRVFDLFIRERNNIIKLATMDVCCRPIQEAKNTILLISRL